MTWVTEAITGALESVPLEDLVDAAGQHVQAKGEWGNFVVGPSLLGTKCHLARLKRFYGHSSQPGQPKFTATQAGRPSARTAKNFARGYFMEGLLVAAMKAYPKREHDGMTVLHDDPWEAYEIIGCSPTLIFDYESLDFPEWETIKFQAHPDVVVNYCGEIELIQIKCPSTFKLQRVEKNGDSEFDDYIMQLITEMYIGRKMGYDIKRTHLLMTSFEGATKGHSDMISRTWEWDEAMGLTVEAETEELLLEYAKSVNGEWPKAYPEDQASTYPCSYCSFSRVATTGLTACDNHKAWDNTNG